MKSLLALLVLISVAACAYGQWGYGGYGGLYGYGARSAVLPYNYGGVYGNRLYGYGWSSSYYNGVPQYYWK